MKQVCAENIFTVNVERFDVQGSTRRVTNEILAREVARMRFRHRRRMCDVMSTVDHVVSPRIFDWNDSSVTRWTRVLSARRLPIFTYIHTVCRIDT